MSLEEKPVISSVEMTPIVHLIPTIPVTVRRQLSQLFAALIGGFGALLSIPPESVLPHITAIFGAKAASWGPFLMAIAFFWNAFTKGKDVQKLNSVPTESLTEQPNQPSTVVVLDKR